MFTGALSTTFGLKRVFSIKLIDVGSQRIVVKGQPAISFVIANSHAHTPDTKNLTHMIYQTRPA